MLISGCRVCFSPSTTSFKIGDRDFLRCANCEAVSLAEKDLPSPEFERRRYLLHNNDPDEPGYRQFLRRLADPLIASLRNNREGLDFGSGPPPGTGMAQLLIEAGHSVTLYDPIFLPDPSAIERRYDFITCCETAEHFHYPGKEFERLGAMLNRNGILAIMTSTLPTDTDFQDWHYQRDPTHVCFYSRKTFGHIAKRLGFSLACPSKNVAIMTDARK